MDDDRREFKNEFPDYIPGQRSKYIEADKIEIVADFKHVLHSRCKEMLQDLRDALADLDRRDFSVYTGTAGIALVFFLASKCVDSKYLEISLSLVEQSLAKTSGRRVSFLNGDPGPLALAAALYHKLGYKEKLHQVIERFQFLHPQVVDVKSDHPDELLYGRAGYLYAQLFINKHTTAGTLSDDTIKKVVDTIIEHGCILAKKQKSRIPLVYEWHEKNYVGAAHGTVGIIYLLLLARGHVRDDDLVTLVKPSLDALLKIRFPSGNLPSSAGNNKDKLIHWCHGAPGAVHLFCLAYQVFKEEQYKKAALDCGEVIWQRGLLRKGCGLCHGTAGNAYSFLALYQLEMAEENVSKDSAAKQLHRACAFAEWCTEYRKHRTRLPDRPLSLFEGKAGIIYLLLDILEPLQARFPAFSL